MRALVRTLLVLLAVFVVIWICLAASDAGGWWPFAAGSMFVSLTVIYLLRCPGTLVDEPEPPVWGLVEYGGIRVAGQIEHRSNDNGLSFIAITPPGRHTISIPTSRVDSIVVCSEEAARRHSARQWVGRVS